MSRIGKLPVEIPQGVSVTITDGFVTVKGPKGELKQDVQPVITVAVEGNLLTVDRKDDSKMARSFHGLYRQLIQNMVTGVTKGFERSLVINGVGYRAEVKGNTLLLNLGYSTQIEYELEEGLSVAVDAQNKITVSGISKERVGQACAEIRSIRPPEPYKGKGVKYEEEHIRRKIGKSGVK
ncbi:50S ribosomal protein L6 [Sediminispirochaeta smaragdinae]|jgi:large subunit ribosomal protein L6|uniref:Large ribosomal subunit protein uL6 n=1 Tax=Sediminispirochaeta smaragdinae (strain DSM 11293 / JCM 15392 / SEBR 4228) TaxID=573413 RepID=E1RCM4_SEDSS|nr:50S ribosomal protein L6 [Sediminispirochaeta smaragdinae]ADK80104.1 ribosomal protein L6 [Sediminispirochaeta smaragdinae DSM 11293]